MYDLYRISMSINVSYNLFDRDASRDISTDEIQQQIKKDAVKVSIFKC